MFGWLGWRRSAPEEEIDWMADAAQQLHQVLKRIAGGEAPELCLKAAFPDSSIYNQERNRYTGEAILSEKCWASFLVECEATNYHASLIMGGNYEGLYFTIPAGSDIGLSISPPLSRPLGQHSRPALSELSSRLGFYDLDATMARFQSGRF